MAVDDHGLEVLKKSGEEVTPGDKSDYYIKTSLVTGSDINSPLPEVVSTTGSVTAVGQNIELECEGCSTVVVTSSGTWSGLFAIDVTNDGTNWKTARIWQLNTLSIQATFGSNDTNIVNVAGFTRARVRTILFSSGQADFVLTGTLGQKASIVISPSKAGFQTTANLADNSGAAITLGQKASASSVPVVLPSDQVVSVKETDTAVSIFNVSTPVADTEVSQALPSDTKHFLLRSRNGGKVQIAYSSGQSGTTYLTIPRGTVYNDDSFYISQTLYFQSSLAGDIIEIIAYAEA